MIATANHNGPLRGRSRSQIVALAELSARLPHRDRDALAVLLAAARPFDDGFRPLRPLWVREATHRALGLLRLFTALRRHEPLSYGSTGEQLLALHLASVLASLEAVDLTRIVPCSAVLREVTRDLVALFEPAVGRLALKTDVALLSLPAYKARALVSLSHELVTNALLHAFEGRTVGRISLRLRGMTDGHARLLVADDGIGFTCGRPDPATSIAGDLSGLLEGELHYCSSAGQGTTAELVFPVR